MCIRGTRLFAIVPIATAAVCGLTIATQANGSPWKLPRCRFSPSTAEAKLGAVAQALADKAMGGRDVGGRTQAALALSYMSDPIAVPEMKRVLESASDAAAQALRALRKGKPLARSEAAD